MESVFLDFQPLNGTTWFYLSFLLMLAVFFRFDRLFSIRNWDLITLFLMVPGLLATSRADRGMLRLLAQLRDPQATSASPNVDATLFEVMRGGYIWLFAMTAYFVFRCLLDLVLVRRPRLDPNLNIAGLAVLGTALLAFLMHEVTTKDPDPAGRASARVATSYLNWSPPPTADVEPSHPVVGVFIVPQVVVYNQLAEKLDELSPVAQGDLEVGVARSAVILCHLLILVALVLIGWQHFGSPASGMSMATLYLLLPLTAINVEKVDHLLPSVLLVWGVYFFRWPWVSGALLGVACMFFYPLFLVPLWAGFHGRRKALPFLSSLLASALAMLLIVSLLDPVRSFMEVWNPSVAWKPWEFTQNPETLGFWGAASQAYRLPIFVVFVASAAALGFWPAEKNLAELIALSACLVLGVQLWYADRGGTYVNWYLPFLLLMIFRPNLTDVRPSVQLAPTSAR